MRCSPRSPPPPAAARTVTGSTRALGLLETAAGWSPTCVWAAVLLFLTRFATLCFDRAADHHGRVRALDPLALQGLTRSVLSSWAGSPSGTVRAPASPWEGSPRRRRRSRCCARGGHAVS
ncbi:MULTISPECIES: hypothetical protein [unclassified Streptomyces]|uniref:hypothetical protein n=1 Tax=unclassified Streptomyces TaxID=2593676 RepID=UPI00143ED1BE|nr:MULTISPECIES: hypothetical protein [unclassified Streptomyces]QIY63672.1 hypothetical protein HEP85_21165 [Streptomyces sp. RPA4-2]